MGRTPCYLRQGRRYHTRFPQYSRCYSSPSRQIELVEIGPRRPRRSIHHLDCLRLQGTRHRLLVRLQKGFNMPRPIMANADLQRILQADEIKAALKPRGTPTKKVTVKKNPLKNMKTMLKLNPYAAVQKRAAQKACAK